jgi:hypothetical protein
MVDPIITPIEREAGVPGLVGILAERLSPTELQPVLLALYRHRAANIRPSGVIAGYAEDRIVQPSGVSPLALLQ